MINTLNALPALQHAQVAAGRPWLLTLSDTTYTLALGHMLAALCHQCLEISGVQNLSWAIISLCTWCAVGLEAQQHHLWIKSCIHECQVLLHI